MVVDVAVSPREDNRLWLLDNTSTISHLIVDAVDKANANAGISGNIGVRLSRDGGHDNVLCMSAAEFLRSARNAVEARGDVGLTGREREILNEGEVFIHPFIAGVDGEPVKGDASAVVVFRHFKSTTAPHTDGTEHFINVINHLGFWDHDGLYIGFLSLRDVAKRAELIKSVEEAARKLNGRIVALDYIPSSLSGDAEHWDCIEGYLSRGRAADVKEIRRYIGALKAANYDINRVGMFYKPTSEQKRVEFLVDGLIPRGEVTTLIANRKAGKTSLLQQLAIRGARLRDGTSESETWLGVPLRKEAFRGVSIVMAGEDGEQVLLARREQMDPDEDAFSVIFRSYRNECERHITELLEEYDGFTDIDLLVIDTAHVFNLAEQDGADSIKSFMAPIKAFAERNNCAIVITLHITKSAFGEKRPESPIGVMNSAYGGITYTAQARVNIAMFLDEINDVVYVGTGPGMHNLDGRVMWKGWRAFKRDEDTLDCIPIPEGAANNA